MSYDAPLRGLKVIDLSQGLAGPYCATLLAQNGADVIKVEPVDGDWSRILGVSHGGHTAFSIAGNLGKRSVALDLKSEAGKSVLWRLLDGADVLIEGFRPGVMARLGFHYEAVAARAAHPLPVGVGLRPGWPTRGATGDGPRAAGLYGPDAGE
jgi:crotonobetainyl-CoA:carnitine CoA-transferase CaiB-like acyl-CoA transferase